MCKRFVRDMGEIWVRYGQDMGKIWARYGRDMGEIWVRYVRGMQEICKRHARDRQRRGQTEKGTNREGDKQRRTGEISGGGRG